MSFLRARTIEVEVYEARFIAGDDKLENDLRTDATVTLRKAGGGAAARTLDYDASRAAFAATGVGPGTYDLEVNAAGLKAQTRTVTVRTAGSREIFVLGKAGMRIYRRGEVEVPFEPLDLIAVSFFPAATDEINAQVAHWGDTEWGGPLDPALPPSAPGALLDYMRLCNLSGLSEAATAKILQGLREDENVQRIGPVISIGKRSLCYLTDELVVRLVAGVSKKTLVKMIEPGLEIVRRISYSPDTFLLRLKEPSTYESRYELLDLAAALAIEDRVLWAEPNLAGTAELDTRGPLNPQAVPWESLWDRDLVGAREAWEVLDKTGGKQAHGEPSVRIAIVDTGIQPSHPSFEGSIAAGGREWKKVCRQLDFRRPKRHKDVNKPIYGKGHGMKVAGVAAARADEPSKVAGAAPNCQVISLIFPETEVETLEMYHRAAIPGRDGVAVADIFVTCVGFGFCSGRPISGLARALFDRLVVKGRGGKGCLFFFSVGNEGRKLNRFYTLDRPWAAYEKTFGIAASTVATDGKTEIRAPYSGCGLVELCAPSSDGRSSRTWSSNLLGRGDPVDYTADFGGTSSATPLAAGVAALVLSARPDLTWTEVRRILRETAEPIDSENQHTIGRWLDIHGKPAHITRMPAVHSAFYGFGRPDAKKAVLKAQKYQTSRSAGILRKVTTMTSTTSSGSIDLGRLFLAFGIYNFLLAGLVLASRQGWLGKEDWALPLFLALGVYNAILAVLLWFEKKKHDFDEDNLLLEETDPQ